MNSLLWADPNILNPNLPEPYAFIDSIIRGVVSDALDGMFYGLDYLRVQYS